MSNRRILINYDITIYDDGTADLRHNRGGKTTGFASFHTHDWNGTVADGKLTDCHLALYSKEGAAVRSQMLLDSIAAPNWKEIAGKLLARAIPRSGEDDIGVLMKAGVFNASAVAAELKETK